MTRCAISRLVLNNKAPSSFGLVACGEAMYVPFQAGFAIELGDRLRKNGYGDQPFGVAIGSSSGSLVAAAVAAGDFNHSRVLEALIEFARETRFRPAPGRPLNPYPQALRHVLDSGLVDFERAATSRTHMVIAASHYDSQALKDIQRVGLSTILSGVGALSPDGPSHFCDGFRKMVETGARLVTPLYFSNKPFLPETGRPATTPETVRLALEASSRAPLLYGGPIHYGEDVLLDGAFADNAPLKLALELGARHVFVLNSSRSGHVFDRPFQTLAQRHARSALSFLEKLSPRRLGVLAKIREAIPAPKPVDVKELEKRYPKRKIQVVHPSDDLTVSRFLESDPDVLCDLYEEGRKQAETIFLAVAPSRKRVHGAVRPLKTKSPEHFGRRT